MPAAPSLQPTLWRTCRVLANPTRLKIFGLLLQQPGQTVSELARSLRLPLSLTSEYLRALEARGLLTARRVGRLVKYRAGPPTGQGSREGLADALRAVFQREVRPVEMAFRLATAFTHPRRVEIFRALAPEPRTVAQIQEATGISTRALLRHLRKLEVREFITHRGARYAAANRSDGLGRELARLAAE
jgi:DNA-binding transcriptional ArsR family regulator